MYRLSMFLIPLLLVGCNAPLANPPNIAAAGDAAVASPDNRDTEYQAPVGAYIKRYFVHAESLRGVKIGDPFTGKLHGHAGSIVCVEMDAKNKTGAYTGPKRTAFLIKDEKVLESDYDSPVCRDQQLIAWPEMDTGASRRGVVQSAGKQQSTK